MDLAAGNTSRKPSVVIQPRKGLFQLDLTSVWQYREMLYFLVWRDVIVRYKQTALGAAWVILQPLITMLIFTLIFGNFAKIPSDGIPYPVFAFSALLPWSYFSQALAKSSSSVVNSSNLVTKIYFPRLLIPLAASVSPVVDLFFSFLVLLVLMAWFNIAPTWGLLALPLFLGLAIMTALAVGLWTSALNVRYRDVGNIILFLSQVWMYASPVAYPVSMVPVKWRLLYSLNPMVGVIEGFRWALLGKESPDFMLMAVSSSVVLALLAGGIVYFKRMEQTFADVI
ncbi:ABC transporter permease [Geotalea uraniireducens]|uniref:Transport permease protein n=1 Tax=Geotalea uraniireducens (strain Rf4) TaxID=351605 RepID=A5G420_GEOUR|nr:ABC transporter permease [Geotalea uraniireducens]ABQ26538.1 ABC-2 type transporter [Geotalea uraniireducens Rf4]